MPDLCAGLDARAAAIVMRVVRNIVNTGRTIACTIHQPAIDIFEVSHLDQSSAPAVILLISDPAACLSTSISTGPDPDLDAAPRSMTHPPGIGG